KCWNTMPTRLRSLGRSVFGSLTCTPLTKMSPFWNGSSALTVLIRVDLPEPEGPHTTTTSLLSMRTLHSLSTCTGPYHLDTLRMSIIAWDSLMAGFFLLSNDRDLLLDALDDPGQAEADDEVDDGREDVGLARPAQVVARHGEAVQHVVG